MKAEGPKHREPDDGHPGAAGRKTPSGPAKKKEPGEKKQDGRNAQIVEVPSGRLQPKMQNGVKKRMESASRGPMNGLRDQRAQWIDRRTETRGLAVQKCHRVVRADETDSEEKERNNLLRNGVRFA